MTSTSRAKNISLVQWFLIDHCSLLRLSPRPGDMHIAGQKYFTGPMVSQRVEDHISSEATLVPSWKWKDWAATPHALLDQKTLLAHLTPSSDGSGAIGDSACHLPINLPAAWPRRIWVWKGVYQAES
jgi:hypothetical protein